MEIVRDGIQLCDDCLIIAVNGDYTGLDYHYGSNWRCLTCTREGTGRAPSHCPFCTSEADSDHGPRSKADDRMAEINAGFAKLGPNLVPNFDSEAGTGISEFSSTPCGCCSTRLAGGRHEFAILGPVSDAG